MEKYMKATRTYLQGCTWCNGTGIVNNANFGMLSLSLTCVCPVCNGNKTILVTEVSEQPISDTELIVPSEEEIISQSQGREDFIKGANWIIKKLNK